jgi:hypothetical protein
MDGLILHILTSQLPRAPIREGQARKSPEITSIVCSLTCVHNLAAARLGGGVDRERSEREERRIGLGRSEPRCHLLSKPGQTSASCFPLDTIAARTHFIILHLPSFNAARRQVAPADLGPAPLRANLSEHQRRHLRCPRPGGISLECSGRAVGDAAVVEQPPAVRGESGWIA